jgi:hypothetical protein
MKYLKYLPIAALFSAVAFAATADICRSCDGQAVIFCQPVHDSLCSRNGH